MFFYNETIYINVGCIEKFGKKMPHRLDLDIAKLDVSANSVKQIMRHFASTLSDCLDYSQICNDLEQLESNDTAAIGKGTMIFHGWNDMINDPIMVFTRLNQPMQTITTPDQQPVNKVWLLLSPKSDGPIHLSRLSKMTRFAKNDHFSLMMDGADTEDSAIAIFQSINNLNIETPHQNHNAA